MEKKRRMAGNVQLAVPNRHARGHVVLAKKKHGFMLMTKKVMGREVNDLDVLCEEK